MKNFDVLDWPHRLGIGSSPIESDIALASISIDGGSGQGSLNSFVLNELGYSVSDLPNSKSLKKGYFWLSKEENKPPILFIVTTGSGDVGRTLKENLRNAFLENISRFKNSRVWIPLLGTGAGGLSVNESYEIIVEVLNEEVFQLKLDIFINLSFPSNRDGVSLFEMIRSFRASTSDKIDSSVFSEIEGETKKSERSGVGSFESQESKESIRDSKYQSKLDEDLKIEEFDFYFVDFIWDKEDQLKRFIEQKIWEIHSDSGPYIQMILNVNRGDFLIAKINLPSEHIVHDLQIHAVGIVESNPGDGKFLNVDWGIRNLNLEFNPEMYYGDEIKKLGYQDKKSVLQSLSADWDLGEMVGKIYSETISSGTATTVTTKSPKNKTETIAGLLSDSDSGEDYLNITNDVNAFARVMAAKSFQPPLAIALFGKWGSGKSFFMGKLKEQISSIANRENNKIFCEGVVQIHFNAWSYLDSNLWASLVSKIFEELNSYITKDTIAGKQKKEIEDHLKESLFIAKEEIGVLKNQKEALEQQIASLNRKKRVIEGKLNEDIKKIRSQSIWEVVKNAENRFDAKSQIKKALISNESFKDESKKLSVILPEEYWSDPINAYKTIKSNSTFLKLFFSKDSYQMNLWALSLIVIGVTFIPVILMFSHEWLRNVNFVVPQAFFTIFTLVGLAWKRGRTIYKELQPVIASFWKIKESYEAKIEEARSKFIQEEKALKLEIAKNKNELIQIEDQIQLVENTKVDLEFRIQNTLATEALYSFIDRRSKSEDYKKYLGLISIIRKDFEILNDLFLGHLEESEKQRTSSEFRSRFEKPLERIILYIDDLDRCPEENVVQVLEAVNLLMAFPLFVVVVGVDARWVKNALIKKHGGQFRMGTNDEIENGYEGIEPSNYLEKIFQIPFQLKSASDTSVKNMIENLAQTKPEIPFAISENQPSEITALNGQEDVGVMDGKNKEGLLDEGNSSMVKRPEGTPLVSDPQRNTSQKMELKSEALMFSPLELSLLKEMSVIIGNNPRAIKRFVNIYRIIKAHEGFDDDSISDEDELLIILFLVAMPLGVFKGLLPDFEKLVFDSFFQNKKFTFFLNEDPNPGKLESELNNLLDINNGALKRLLALEIKAFRKHFNFIKRFTFSYL